MKEHEDKIKVYFRVKYTMEYDDSSDIHPFKCSARLSLYLPCDKNGNIIPALKDRDKVVMGERLVDRWGRLYQSLINNDDSIYVKYRSKKYHTNDLQELKMVVNEEIAKVLSTLEDVRKKNGYVYDEPKDVIINGDIFMTKEI